MQQFKTVFIAATLSALPLCAAKAVEDKLPGPIPAQVVRVVDGDTVVVRARIWLGQDVETHVRLAGIDTPEKRGRCDEERNQALKAQAFAEAQLANGEISLRDIVPDKYGQRVVAHVITAKGEDLSQLLVAQRLARAYDGGHKQPWCE